jgi:hypothetical protein
MLLALIMITERCEKCGKAPAELLDVVLVLLLLLIPLLLLLGQRPAPSLHLLQMPPLTRDEVVED